MGLFAQHVISVITVAVVLVTSVNCLCGAATVSSDDAGCHEPRDTAGARSCCDHEKSPRENHRGSGDRDHACNHCQSSLVSESASTNNPAHLFDFSFATLSLHSGGINLIAAAPFEPHHFRNDLPPPVDPPTLLSLGCALIV